MSDCGVQLEKSTSLAELFRTGSDQSLSTASRHSKAGEQNHGQRYSAPSRRANHKINYDFLKPHPL
jgi:hypothetical protein